nr:type II secretion system F family protein [Allomuricauda sp.]
MAIDISSINKKEKGATGSQTLSLDLSQLNFGNSKKLGAKQKSVLYKDLATLLKAGVDFKSALEILANQQKKKNIKLLLSNLKNDVVGGKGFHEAMENAGTFTPYEHFSVKIGEETKKLNVVLLELHRYFKRQLKLRKQIISVITYPAFVLVLTVGVLYFMLAYVVPMFKSVFNQFDAELPALTKNIIGLSEKFPILFLGFILIILILFALGKANSKNPQYRNIKSKVLLKTPYFGKLIKRIYLARFCQFLDLLLTSKTPLTESLDMVKKMIGFYPIESSIDDIKRRIIKGSSLSSAMEKHPIYENKLISMIAVAEEINELDAMFGRLADEYDEEVEHRTKMIGVILEPAIIILIGLIVGTIMIAMYAPMFDLSKIINGG